MLDQVSGLSLDNSAPASIRFKVPDKKASYEVIFDAILRTQPKDRVTVKVNSKSGAEYEFKPGESKIPLRYVTADQNGIIHINFKRQGEKTGYLYLTSMTVNKE